MENEEIGDRTSSQFLRDLRKVVNSADTKFDEFVVTLWKNRLPQQVQQVLAVSSEMNVGKLATMADKIHEIRPSRRQIHLAERWIPQLETERPGCSRPCFQR